MASTNRMPTLRSVSWARSLPKWLPKGSTETDRKAGTIISTGASG